jgi:hypothetical protein
MIDFEKQKGGDMKSIIKALLISAFVFSSQTFAMLNFEDDVKNESKCGYCHIRQQNKEVVVPKPNEHFISVCPRCLIYSLPDDPQISIQSALRRENKLPQMPNLKELGLDKQFSQNPLLQRNRFHQTAWGDICDECLENYNDIPHILRPLGSHPTCRHANNQDEFDDAQAPYDYSSPFNCRAEENKEYENFVESNGSAYSITMKNMGYFR